MEHDIDTRTSEEKLRKVENVINIYVESCQHLWNLEKHDH